jgi:Zn-dependent protease
VNAFQLFTAFGIPVWVSPFYFVLLWMFSQGQNAVGGVISALCITLGLLVHEFGHALVARYLRHQPTIMLHGFGGLTSRQRSGRDVEEALIIAMGPAAGLALGLATWGCWSLGMRSGGAEIFLSGVVYFVIRKLLYVCIIWNFLNLMPLWPLDGGQLLRLGLMRITSPRRADLTTHGLALAILAVAGFFVLRSGFSFNLLLVAMLAMQNIRALRGEGSSGVVHVKNRQAVELVTEAKRELAAGQFREAARLAHQARSFDRVPPPLLDEIWEVLGVATTELAEHEEALSYLKRARPSERVQLATRTCLSALGREDELADVQVRWQAGARARNMGRWLGSVLGFIAVAVVLVFTTSLRFFFL